MKLRILAACAALSTLTATTLAAGPALAGDVVTAKLATPIAEKTKFIAGGAIFQCEGDTCVALAPGSQTFAVATCRTLAAKLGPVESFAGRKALEADRLAACNEKALAAGAATIAKK